jgi:hypothetical protein
LLYGVAFALPFIGCRQLYGILSTFLNSPTFSNSLAAKVSLSVVPEMIAVMAFTAAGLSTLQIAQKIKRADKEGGKPYTQVTSDISLMRRQ